MENKTSNIKRRHYFIKKEFQSQFIIRVILLLVLGIIISSGLLFMFSQDSLTSSYQGSRLIIRTTGVSILPKLFLINIITLFLICIATMVVILFISHKIAGPIYRFETEIRSIGQGDLTRRITLRKDDQFSELGESMNDMVENLSRKITDIKTQVTLIDKMTVSGDGHEAISEKLSNLNRDIESNFKI